MIMVKKKTKVNIFQDILMVVVAMSLLLSSVTGFMSIPQYYYYGAIIVFGAMILFHSAGGKIGLMPLLNFFIISALSILFNNPPQYFRAWQRLLGFALIIMIVAPVVVNKKIHVLRLRLFDYLIWMCVVLSVGSFICYFLNLNFFVRDNEVLAIQAGWFAGLFRHSMLLGPIAGISTIYIFVRFLGAKRRRFFLLAVAACCLGSCLLAASRAAVGACIFGMAITYICYFREQTSRGILLLVLFVGILFATFPFWGDLTEFLRTKQENSVAIGGTFISREGIWAIRLKEILSNPIIGVGFCCVDTWLTFVDTKTGIIEPGSSWLAVFSMTGILGFICFLWVFIKSFRYSYLHHVRANSCLYCGCLGFFAVHLLFEGYVLAAGSFLALLYWLLLGCVWSKKIIK